MRNVLLKLLGLDTVVKKVNTLERDLVLEREHSIRMQRYINDIHAVMHVEEGQEDVMKYDKYIEREIPF